MTPDPAFVERLARDGIRIAGAGEPGELGRYPIVDPATEETIGHAPEGSAAQARRAARAAREAFPAWAATAREERARLLARAADAIRDRAARWLPLVIAETGCTEAVGRQMQIPVAASRFDASARHALHGPVIPLAPQPMPATPLAPGGLVGALARRQPVGAVACITPYNFPIVSCAGKIGPALAAGNTVVVRPAPQDPLAVIALVRLLEEVGFPPGVVSCVCGSTPETGEALVASEDIDMVSFTGSTPVGLQIARECAGSLKRTLLELGGKGAALVLEDADLERAVDAVASTFAFHSGQICTAPTRAIVHRSLFEPFVDALARRGAALPIGDPRDPATVVGPVISAAQRERIEAHLDGARREGGELRLGGRRPAKPGRGFYVAPALVVGSPAMRIAREEVFGPVVVAHVFDDEEQAVAIANDTPYGLYDYVFSRDSARAFALSAQLRSGNVGINTTQRNPETPFGGTKRSGIGRDGGEFGLHAYSELQSVVWPG